MNQLNQILNSSKLVKSFQRTFHLKSRVQNNDDQIFVYNTLSKSKEPLNLKHKNTLYWYSCGPTVYDSAHIGHAR
jgi:hypothetical protein